jgi:hypothetical protein
VIAALIAPLSPSHSAVTAVSRPSAIAFTAAFAVPIAASIQ